MTSTTMELADKYADISWDDNNKARDALEQRIKELERDAKRLDWVGVNGSFGVDSVTGEVGGNGQRRKAATRIEIDRAMSEAALTKAVEISQEYKLP